MKNEKSSYHPFEEIAASTLEISEDVDLLQQKQVELLLRY